MHRLVYLAMLAFVATIVGGALYVHGIYGGDRDALLLTYLLAEAIGLGYLAIKRPLCWIGSLRITRVRPARMGR